jgi:hypothetical protein
MAIESIFSTDLFTAESLTGSIKKPRMFLVKSLP